MFKIGVMASGGGSNFKAIIDHIGSGDLEAQCKFLITNNAGCQKATAFAVARDVCFANAICSRFARTRYVFATLLRDMRSLRSRVKAI